MKKLRSTSTKVSDKTTISISQITDDTAIMGIIVHNKTGDLMQSTQVNLTHDTLIQMVDIIKNYISIPLED